jgi:Zinc carboxypeptidase
MMRLQYVLTATCLSILLLFSGWSASSAAGVLPTPEPIGFSQGGLPLMVYRLGDGPNLVLLLGAQHGGPEINTYRLTQALLEYFAENPGEVPSSVTLAFLPRANPDGLVAGTRRFLSGVDPNRNWGGPSWEPDGYDSNGRFERGLGGPEPFSEQETRALAEFVIQQRPIMVVNYHSAGGFMFGGRDGIGGALADAYESASGYYRPVPGSGQRLLGYRASGTTSSWLSEQGINGIFLELTSPGDPEFNRNLAGMRAMLAVLARNTT